MQHVQRLIQVCSMLIKNILKYFARKLFRDFNFPEILFLSRFKDKMDGFQVVSRKKKGKRKGIGAPDILVNTTLVSDDISDKNLRKKVNLAR